MSIENEVLAAMIRNRLLGDLRTSALTIDVCCSDGNVRLIGCVDAEEQKKTAMHLISGVIGVIHVTDELKIRRCR